MDKEKEMFEHLQNMYEMASMVSFTMMQLANKEEENSRLMKNFLKAKNFIEEYQKLLQEEANNS